MIGWDALELARKTPNLRFVYEDWCPDSYLFFDESGFCKDDDGTKHTLPCYLLSKEGWRLEKPEPKIIKWYRPKVVWYEDEPSPCVLRDNDRKDRYHDNKDLINWSALEYKVLEWEEKEFPETWDA